MCHSYPKEIERLDRVGAPHRVLTEMRIVFRKLSVFYPTLKRPFRFFVSTRDFIHTKFIKVLHGIPQVG